MRQPGETHRYREFVLPAIKIALILAIIFLTSNGAAQFAELGVSVNPIRNRTVFLGIWALSIYVVISVAFLRPWAWRALFAALIIISTVTGDIYRAITDSYLDYGDLYSLWISRTDWRSSVQNYWLSMLTSGWRGGVLLAAIMLPAHLAISRHWTVNAVRWLYVLPPFLIALMISQKGAVAAIGLPEQVKASGMFMHIIHFDATNDFDRLRKNVLAQPAGVNSARPHLVMIVDESIRGDFLSINNPDAGTTPFLVSQGGRLANFGYASSTHNCSHFANANLRYGTRPANPKDSLLTNPSIWEYAKNAGYRTVFIDAQGRHGELLNFMSPKERRQIDSFEQFDDIEAVQRSDSFVRKDQVAAERLRTLLKMKNPQFIIVNKAGAHAPYEEKYPVSETKFTPVMALGEAIHTGLSKQKLINSYRNAVMWSTDAFFSKLLAENYRLENAVVLYTGDHGQNLLDKGASTHCGSKISLSVMALVPLFFITDNAELHQWLAKAAGRNHNKASHFNIFPTLLTIMGYQKQDVEYEYDPSLDEKLSGERYWFTGNLLTGEYNRHVFDFN